nr:coiled coil domain containing protein 147 [Hymenolepis microstoma]
MIELFDKVLLKGVVKPAIDESTFAQLQDEYHNLLDDLKKNKLLDNFREEYEKAMAALFKSHENEKKLMKRCRELKADILSNSIRIQHINKISSDSPENISKLKKELEHARGLVVAADAKENQIKDRIKIIKENIATLIKVIEKGESDEIGANAVAEVTKNLEEVTRVKVKQEAENARLRKEIDSTKEQVNTLQDELIQAQQKIAELGKDIQQKSSEAQRELRKKEKMEKELNEVREQVEVKQSEIQTITLAIEELQNELEKRQEEKGALQLNNEQSIRKLQLSEAKLAEVQKKLDAQISLTESLRLENEAKLVEVKQKEEELNAIKSENAKLNSQNESSNKRLQEIEEKKQELEQTRSRIRESIDVIEREILETRKAMKRDRKVCEDLTRQRDALSKSLFKVQTQAGKQADLLKIHEQSKQNLEQEISNYNQETLTQKEMISLLEKERDHYIKEASCYTQKVLDFMEEVKYREMEIFDNKKKIAEAQTKLKQQENLYEAVKSDRNLYSKNLIEAQEEISEMKRKLNIMTQKIGQIKDEIASKDVLMVQETAECNKMSQERNDLQKELEKIKEITIKNKTFMEAQKKEEKQLVAKIKEAETEHSKYKKVLSEAINDKNVLEGHLSRRNDELVELHEKIYLLENELLNGEKEYAKVLENLKEVRDDISRCRKDKALLQADLAQMENLKREVIQAEKELRQEEVRCKVLEDELQVPINVHRWRQFEMCNLEDWNNVEFQPEGGDPTCLEMIKKIHTLQKRLLNKTEEVVQKELQIGEKERLYVELEQTLVRKPGPEVAEQMFIYQNALKEKQAALKVMKQEAEKYEESIKQYKQKLEDLNNETEDMKKTYIANKLESDKARGRQKKEKEPMLNLVVEKASPILSVTKSIIERGREERNHEQKGVGKIEGETEKW